MMSADSGNFVRVRRASTVISKYEFLKTVFMSLTKTPPIPPMEEGPERELMAFLFLRVKRIKGLTTDLDQQAGINGRWLKPDEPRNIPSRRLLRLIIHTAHFRGREQFKKDANQAIDFLFDVVIPHYIRILASKHRQRPPWLRRRFRRRYHPSILTHKTTIITIT